MIGRARAAEKRGPGFVSQATVCVILLRGAPFGIASSLLHGG
jgi:hypothetical protein